MIHKQYWRPITRMDERRSWSAIEKFLMLIVLRSGDIAHSGPFKRSARLQLARPQVSASIVVSISNVNACVVRLRLQRFAFRPALGIHNLWVQDGLQCGSHFFT